MNPPFKWFGGKRRVADYVWSRFGKTGSYIEPFLGSGAVFVRSPGTVKYSVLNDKDCLVANFWRAAKREPEALADWGMTEYDALRYCYDHGYDWGGLYRHANRVSCWCCPLQDLGRLRFLYRYHPALWRRLREMDDREIERGCRKFRPDYSVAELEMWFAAEEKQQRMSFVEGKDGIYRLHQL